MDTFFSVDVPFQITLNLCQVDIKLAYVCAHMHTYLQITCWVHLVLLICILFFHIYTDHLLLDKQLGCSSLEDLILFQPSSVTCGSLCRHGAF